MTMEEYAEARMAIADPRKPRTLPSKPLLPGEPFVHGDDGRFGVVPTILPELPSGWSLTTHIVLSHPRVVLWRDRDGAFILPSSVVAHWKGQITDFEFYEGAQWTPEQIAAMKERECVPAGCIVEKTDGFHIYAGNGTLDCWERCDGHAVHRVDCAKLFAVIGTTHGAGDGVSTFNVPDLRGRVTDPGHTHEIARAAEDTGDVMAWVFGNPSIRERYLAMAAAKPVERGVIDRSLFDTVCAERDEAQDLVRRLHEQVETQAGMVMPNVERETKLVARTIELLVERDSLQSSASHYKAECQRLADGPPADVTPKEVATHFLNAERDHHRAQFPEMDWTLVRLTEIIRAARLHGRQSVAAEAACDVPFIRGGHYDPSDAERYGCRLTWWPDELQPPYFAGEKGSRTVAAQSIKVVDEAAQLRADLAIYREARDLLTDANATLGATNERLRDEIAALTVEKNALADKLGWVPAPPPEAPKPNPFREFPNDPRRSGPL